MAKKTTEVVETAPTTAPGATPPAPSQTDAFLATLQSRLLGQSDIVSSMDTQLEQTYAKAAEGVVAGRDANTERITSQFNREIDYSRQQGAQSFTQAVEGRRGFGTQRTALIALQTDIDKNLKDLAQRREELILQGESQAASQLAQLQVDQLKTKMESQKTFFSQLLGMGQFANDIIQGERQYAMQQAQLGLQTAQFNEGVRQFEVNKDFKVQEMAESKRQFEANYGLNVAQFKLGVDQYETSKQQFQQEYALKEKEFGQRMREFDLTKKLTDAQIQKLYYDMTPQYTADGIAFPSLGENGNTLNFKPNGKLTEENGKSLGSAEKAVQFINDAELAYFAAAGDEYTGNGAGVLSRIKGVARYAGSTSGVFQDWKNYENLLESRQAFIAKELGGESGNLAQQEQTSAMKRFPNRWSSPEEAKFAFEQARRDVRNSISNFGTFTDDTSGNAYSGGQPTQQLQFSVVTGDDGKQWTIID